MLKITYSPYFYYRKEDVKEKVFNTEREYFEFIAREWGHYRAVFVLNIEEIKEKKERKKANATPRANN